MKIICLFKKDYLRNENIVRTTKVYHTVVVQNFIENLCQSPVGKMRKLLRRHTIHIKCNDRKSNIIALSASSSTILLYAFQQTNVI